MAGDVKDDLKPCPFCGNPAQTNILPLRRVIYCTGCAVKAENADTWNRRDGAPAAAAIRDAALVEAASVVDAAVYGERRSATRNAILALRTQPAPSVKVKPLLWIFDEAAPSTLDADGCGILYRILKRSDGTATLRIGNMSLDHSEHDSTKAAIDAAQSHVNRRILDALE